MIKITTAEIINLKMKYTTIIITTETITEININNQIYNWSEIKVCEFNLPKLELNN